MSGGEIYRTVGINNRSAIVQSSRLLPFHEDITKVNPFDSPSVQPGQWTRIKLDMKYQTDRELVLNDIRLQFNLDFSAAPAFRSSTATGMVFATRGTDLIRQFIVKINEDIIYKTDKSGELTQLWLMQNHKSDGDSYGSRCGYMLNYGNIPQGDAPPLYYNSTNQNWYTGSVTAGTGTDDTTNWSRAKMTVPGQERHDGRPRLIFDDSASPNYSYMFDISLNQICGPIFSRFHLRRVEYIQIEIQFEPWTSRIDTQKFLLFKTNPTAGALAHPYQYAYYNNVQIRQYRTTLLDGTSGFSLPDSRMLSWMIKRYSMRPYTFDFTNSTSIDIQLKDWEIRTNITRMYWCLAPTNTTLNRSTDNCYLPYFPPGQFENLFGVELWWKNDKVLDLDTTFQVYRHYVLAENKRYGLRNPFIRFYRLEQPYTNSTNPGVADDVTVQYKWDNINKTTMTLGSSVSSQFPPLYEAGLYMIDFHMNIQAGVPGADIVDGIVNDTSDYIVRLKLPSDVAGFRNTGVQTLWVFLEYETLVNLAGNSSQFNRASQIVTKQLNLA